MKPPADQDSPRPRFRRRAPIAAVLMTVSAGAAVALWRSTGSDRVERRPNAASVTPPAGVAATDFGGNIGVESCVECHAGRVAEFRRTRHSVACVEPTPERMPEGFSPGRNVLRTRDPVVRFEMKRRGDDYFQSGVTATSAGEHRVTSKIGFAYGSGGTTDEVYFAWRGDRLFELPAVWLHGREEWGAAKFSPYAGANGYARDLGPRCLECHTTWFRHVAGTANEYDPHSFLLGVTCERCHGPASGHVEHHRSHPGSEPEKIVRPADLPRERQIDLCAQCHSNAIRSKTEPFAYRPGEPLEDYFRVLRTSRPEDDHVANQVGYMRQSRCFVESGSMTCTTCHDPHRPQTGADAVAVRTSCLKCHAGADCTERPGLPARVRDDCTSCHMPRRNKIQVNFRTASEAYVAPAPRFEHRIAVYPEARDEVMWAWSREGGGASQAEAGRLATKLARHWRDEAERLRSEYRFLAAIEAYRQSLRFVPDGGTRTRLGEVIATHTRLDDDWFVALRQIEEGRLREAARTLEGMLAVKPDLADAHGRLGFVYAQTGRRAEAVEHLEAVGRLDPDNVYGVALLAWMALVEGRFAEAADLYRRADEVEPRTPKIEYNLGLSLLKAGRPTEAGQAFRTLLEVDPDHAGGCQGLAQALRGQKRPADAAPFARRAVELTRSSDADALMTLAETYADLGRFRDAADAAAQAARAAARNYPGAVPGIQSRLAEFRSRAGP
jgi:tetratricopeptide (TPR) repeat protein